MLENGDLIFVKDLSDMGQAIQESTGNYSHAAIFMGGLVFHATVEGGVLAQSPEDFFEAEKVYDLYRYPKIDLKEVLRRLSKNATFYRGMIDLSVQKDSHMAIVTSRFLDGLSYIRIISHKNQIAIF